MSRIGKKEIVVPAGVEVTIDTNTVTVKGPKGTLTEHYNPIITVENHHVAFSGTNTEKDTASTRKWKGPQPQNYFADLSKQLEEIGKDK